jgi:hypothetical protein
MGVARKRTLRLSVAMPRGRQNWPTMGRTEVVESDSIDER